MPKSRRATGRTTPPNRGCLLVAPIGSTILYFTTSRGAIALAAWGGLIGGTMTRSARTKLFHVAVYAGLGLFIIVGLALLSGCALGVGYDADGNPFPCLKLSGIGGTPEQAGGLVSTVLNAIGVPGAAVIGTGVTGVLAAAGWGAKQRRVGENHGWDEREKAAAIQLPLPPAGGVGGSIAPAPGP